ncbi:MAG: FecR domain-containing protein [Bacteroidota bacterium]
MTENDVKRLMQKYLDGTITEVEEKRLEQFDGILLSKNEKIDFKSEGHKANVKQNLSRIIRKSNKARPLYKGLRIAASWALIITLSIVTYNWLNQVNQPKPIPEIVEQTEWGQKLNLTLTDGTRVILNSGSTLRFPERFDGDSRVVELIGEAFFDVVKNKDKPFLIQTAALTTTVLGTSFNINAYPDQAETAVTLASGKVKIASADSTVFIHPNQQAIFNNLNKTFTTSQVQIRPYTDWRNGIIHINDATLAETADILERWYGVDFVFENEKLQNFHITATYDNQTLATVLESIKHVKKGLGYEYLENNRILITGRGSD